MPESDALYSVSARDGVLLRYRRWAPSGLETAPALILLHGAASNGGRWWRYVEHSALQVSHRLLRPDLRGHGESRWRGPATMETWCEDLRELLNQEQLERAVLVGHCLGANLALQFAARHPQRCAGLVLVEPMLPQALLGRLARVRPAAPLLRLLIGLIRCGNRLGLYRRTLQSVDLRALDQQYGDQSDKTAMKGRYASPWHDLRVLPSAQYLQNLLEVLRPPPLQRIQCQTLALLSAGRFMADPQRTRAGLASLPRVEIRELAAEHWIPTEQPDAMRMAIDGFVIGLDQSANCNSTSSPAAFAEACDPAAGTKPAPR